MNTPTRISALGELLEIATAYGIEVTLHNTTWKDGWQPHDVLRGYPARNTFVSAKLGDFTVTREILAEMLGSEASVDALESAHWHEGWGKEEGWADE